MSELFLNGERVEEVPSPVIAPPRHLFRMDVYAEGTVAPQFTAEVVKVGTGVAARFTSQQSPKGCIDQAIEFIGGVCRADGHHFPQAGSNG